ncbi:MAG: GMC family oxidoreductase [Bryobacteraceae bacterium]
MKSPLFGKFEKPEGEPHMLGAIQKLTTPMRRFGEGEEVDYAIVGVGGGGGVLAQRLARAGFRVIGFDAGPFWDSERDWVSDEAGSHRLYWNDHRITGGNHPLALGANNCGKGVGGSTVHWSAFTPRLHPSDFHTYSLDGVGVDWPITYDDIKPYYELMELEMPVAGPAMFPWGYPHGYPYAPHATGGVADIMMRGCVKLGIRVCPGGPVAILEGSRGDRPHCIYRGFCHQGCKVGAKATTLITHVPDAMANGAEIRADSMVSRVELGANRRVTGVHYFDRDGNRKFQKAKAVIVAGYSIETPRLLLNSACPSFENGLANSSGVLGRYLMAQAGNVALARFEELVRMYKAPPANCMTEEFYETDPRRDFARGFGIQSVSPLPISFAKEMMVAKGAWGWGMRRVMMDYNHWAAIALIGELLPHEDNRVELAEEKDQWGIPVAKVTFNLHDNDNKMIAFGKGKLIEVMEAAGGRDLAQESRFAHLVGAARMGNDPATSVVDGFGRTHDIANLFICDGSIMPTQGSANPGLTVQALAARTADYLISRGESVFNSVERDMTPGPVRRKLAPPDTFGHGVPRLA